MRRFGPAHPYGAPAKSIGSRKIGRRIVTDEDNGTRFPEKVVGPGEREGISDASEEEKEDRQENRQRHGGEGKEEVIEPDACRQTELPDYPAWRWLTAPVEVLWGPDSLTIITILVFVLMVGSAFAVMDRSGILKAAIGRIVRAFGRQMLAPTGEIDRPDLVSDVTSILSPIHISEPTTTY